jgi:hypothetical protein
LISLSFVRTCKARPYFLGPRCCGRYFLALRPIVVVVRDNVANPARLATLKRGDRIDIRVPDLAGAATVVNFRRRSLPFIRDLTHGVSTHSQGLPDAAIAKVKEQSKFVDMLTVRLDPNGNANDKGGRWGQSDQLEGLLKTIRDQYNASK